MTFVPNTSEAQLRAETVDIFLTTLYKKRGGVVKRPELWCSTVDRLLQDKVITPCLYNKYISMIITARTTPVVEREREMASEFDKLTVSTLTKNILLSPSPTTTTPDNDVISKVEQLIDQLSDAIDLQCDDLFVKYPMLLELE